MKHKKRATIGITNARLYSKTERGSNNYSKNKIKNNFESEEGEGIEFILKFPAQR